MQNIAKNIFSNIVWTLPFLFILPNTRRITSPLSIL